MARTSLKAAVRAAQTEDKKLLANTVTTDSFVNFAHKMGIGADNPMTSATYGFNPITRNRIQLEWIHRGSWIGGMAVDVVADDMVRAGVDYATEIPPDQSEVIDRYINLLNTWPTIGDTIRWGRLYGGCIGVVMIDGQDPRTPLRLDTIGPNQYRGILVLDRWMVDPSTDDLVTEMGPHIGSPRYYRVSQSAPAFRGSAIHHSRVAIRHIGVNLPYQQRLVENLWGTSVLERLYDRMVAFDSATTGAAQLVYKAYLRTLSVEGLRDVVSMGGKALEGLVNYADMMRRFQSIEGLTLIDAKDKLEAQSHTAFSGLSDALMQFGQQLSGALGIPLTRLFGQSPAGLNSTGESDLRMYYDNINQQQNTHIHHGTTLIYKCAAASKGIKLPPNFALKFKPLWQMTDKDKSDIAKTNSETVSGAFEAGLISAQSALKELRQSSRVTGVFTNITTEDIAKADAEVAPPPGEGAMPMIGPDGQPIELPGAMPPGAGALNGKIGPNGQAPKLGTQPGRREQIQFSPPGRRPTNRGPGEGPSA